MSNTAGAVHDVVPQQMPSSDQGRPEEMLPNPASADVLTGLGQESVEKHNHIESSGQCLREDPQFEKRGATSVLMPAAVSPHVQCSGQRPGEVSSLEQLGFTDRPIDHMKYGNSFLSIADSLCLSVTSRLHHKLARHLWDPPQPLWTDVLDELEDSIECFRKGLMTERHQQIQGRGVCGNGEGCMKCSLGHALIQRKAETEYECDICSVRIRTGSIFADCRRCDFSVCKTSLRQVRDEVRPRLCAEGHHHLQSSTACSSSEIPIISPDVGSRKVLGEVQDLMLDDLPKWQVKMLQKREKATRAGKEKLARSIDKEILTILQNAAPAPIG